MLCISEVLSFGQIVKIQYGKNWSKLKWYTEDKFSGYNETLSGNVFTFGIDYFNKKYFGFSTNISYLQKNGEKSYVEGGPSPSIINGKTLIEQFSLNSKMNLRYPFKEKLISFIGIGPTYDFLLYHENEKDRISQIKSGIPGLVLGGGVYYFFSTKIQLGLNTDYDFYFSNLADLKSRPSPDMTGFLSPEKIRSRTLRIELSFGYKLK
jgi:hypothetical protein